MQETFGVRFQRFRKAKNLTQEDIANKFNNLIKKSLPL